ncbi:MAG: Ubiquinone/menaquinone biosynthesis C-methyltransferase UbiE [Legionellaceae bacterium]
MANNTVDFGFQQIPTEEKVHKVAEVFHRVAQKYDVMNDLMSMGIHRLWKRYTIELCQLRPGQKALDVAGGTGDLTAALAHKVGSTGQVWLTDINNAMLLSGKTRLLNQGIWNNVHFVQGNAECLPFPDNYFDCITIAFGLRNVTDKEAALQSMYRILKPGGKLLILEFSQPILPLLQWFYDQYSFKILPTLGDWIAKDAPSYQYLVESIRKHPNQETLLNMMKKAGIEGSHYHNLSGGIVALHRGYKY